MTTIAQPIPCPALGSRGACRCRAGGPRRGPRMRTSARAVVRRRRRVAGALAVVVLVAAALFAAAALSAVTPSSAGPAASSEPPLVPVVQTSYVVRPGDTLWVIARALQPSGDVRPLVDRLAALRRGTPLRVGERVELR